MINVTKNEILGWYNSGKPIKKLVEETTYEKKLIELMFKQLNLDPNARPIFKPLIFQITDGGEIIADSNNAAKIVEVQNTESVENHLSTGDGVEESQS